MEVHIGASGEYDLSVNVRRRCGLFVKLLWPLVLVAGGDDAAAAIYGTDTV